MRRVKKSPYSRLRKNKKAASPAISMVIITAVTVVLVLVTGNYAYQVLERQRGASEFETVKKSILAFDDAVRDVAWDKGGSRSARFTVNYGLLSSSTLPLVVNVTDYPGVSYSNSIGYVRYSISTNYITFGNEYENYILGDNKTVVSSGTESFSRVFIKQELSSVSITLNYRVRAMKTYTVNVTQDSQQWRVSYVDIRIIRMIITSLSKSIGDFDLAARSFNITTISYGGSDGYGYEVKEGKCSVQLGEEPPVVIPLEDGNKVVFNFIVAEIKVST